MSGSKGHSRDTSNRNTGGSNTNRPLNSARIEQPGALYNESNVGIQRVAEVKTLKALCWCGRKTIEVPQADVRKGLTASCGKENCHE